MQKEVDLTREDFARYPFLRSSTNFIEKFDVNLGELSKEEYPTVVNEAVRWVQFSIEGKEFIIDERDPETYILAYPLALAFIYGIKKDWVVNKFATAEQKRINFLLQNETNVERIAKIAEKGFGWDVEAIGVNLEEKKFDLSINVTNYLESAPHLHASNWKLINRYNTDGKVYIKKTECGRLLSEAARNKILSKNLDEEIKKFKLPEKFKPDLDSLMAIINQNKDIYEESKPIPWVEGARPPCIIRIMEDLEAGKNLSHMARFTITTFLINAGKNVDDVLELFSRVPDFDISKARYQVEHIAGEIGSKQKYKTPKCDVLRSFGLCVGSNDLCSIVWLPSNYYKKKISQMEREPDISQAKTFKDGQKRGSKKNV